LLERGEATCVSASYTPSRIVLLVFKSSIESYQADESDGDGRLSGTVRMFSAVGYLLTKERAQGIIQVILFYCIKSYKFVYFRFFAYL
jgi:hypothetical protein